MVTNRNRTRDKDNTFRNNVWIICLLWYTNPGSTVSVTKWEVTHHTLRNVLKSERNYDFIRHLRGTRTSASYTAG